MPTRFYFHKRSRSRVWAPAARMASMIGNLYFFRISTFRILMLHFKSTHNFSFQITGWLGAWHRCLPALRFSRTTNSIRANTAR